MLSGTRTVVVGGGRKRDVKEEEVVEKKKKDKEEYDNMVYAEGNDSKGYMNEQVYVIYGKWRIPSFIHRVSMKWKSKFITHGYIGDYFAFLRPSPQSP